MSEYNYGLMALIKVALRFIARIRTIASFLKGKALLLPKLLRDARSTSVIMIAKMLIVTFYTPAGKGSLVFLLSEVVASVIAHSSSLL
jgi:uncharacterized membrane protein YobD (UPF0266 family)